jgi:cytochrome c oxidase subunit 2
MSRKGIVLFEGLALMLVVLSVTAIFLPMWDDVLNPEKKEPKTIVIRAQVKEAGGFEPSVIKVKKGEKVRIVVEGMDVTHGFTIKSLGVDLGEIKPGEKKAFEFVADKEGVYVFKCTIMCSPMHNFMKGVIIVEGE